MNWETEKKKFEDFIIENNVIGFFENPIILKSGRKSYWYVNWRTISEDVYLFDILTDYIISFIEFLELKPNCFYGVPEGATKLGVITQFKWAKQQKKFKKGAFNLPMGRAKPKKHGDPKDKYFIGVPKGKVIILEDTATTGGSLLKCINDLKSLNIDTLAAVVLTDRNEIRDDGKTVKQVINERGIKYFAMSNAVDILPNLKPNQIIAKHIKDYFKKYGSSEIEF
jgi:orotate phosphoribosyltransferase